MIIKSISTSNAGNLIRYIFKENKLVKMDRSKFIEGLQQKLVNGKALYIAGQKVSKQQMIYLMANDDAITLSQRIKNYTGTTPEFIREQLIKTREQLYDELF